MAKKIKIDSELFEKLRKCSEAAGYSSPEEFIAHVLEKSVQEITGSDDEEKVKERLKGLGYLG